MATKCNVSFWIRSWAKNAKETFWGKLMIFEQILWIGCIELI